MAIGCELSVLRLVHIGRNLDHTYKDILLAQRRLLLALSILCKRKPPAWFAGDFSVNDIIIHLIDRALLLCSQVRTGYKR